MVLLLFSAFKSAMCYLISALNNYFTKQISPSQTNQTAQETGKVTLFESQSYLRSPKYLIQEHVRVQDVSILSFCSKPRLCGIGRFFLDHQGCKMPLRHSPIPSRQCRPSACAVKPFPVFPSFFFCSFSVPRHVKPTPISNAAIIMPSLATAQYLNETAKKVNLKWSKRIAIQMVLELSKMAK